MNALQRFKNLDIMVAVPSTGMWYEDFGKSLCMMLLTCAQRKIGNYKTQQVRLLSSKGSILPNLRAGALDAAKKAGVDYLLWVDSDQSFPRDTLHRLVTREKDVVGANIATKAIPNLPTARQKPTVGEPEWGSLVWTPPMEELNEKNVLEKVWRLGCGLTLLSKKAINALPLNCFEMKYKPDVERYQGEDWQMCEYLEAAGIDIWVDHELSNLVGHHGTFNFTHEYNGVKKEDGQHP